MNFDNTFLDGFQTMTSTPRHFPSVELKDVRGNIVPVQQLARDYRLIIITLKNTTCPVCPQLLYILNLYGIDPDCSSYEDPFTSEILEIDEVTKRYFRLILHQDAYFIVLCPGSEEDVARVQDRTRFPYPFIGGDQAMTLGKSLKMNMSDDELWPATFEVVKDSLVVNAIYIGRSAGNYFHQPLLKVLVHDRGKSESKGIIAMRDAYDTVDRLKRKSVKCENQSLASWILTLSPSRVKSSPTTHSNKSSSLLSLTSSPASASPTTPFSPSSSYSSHQSLSIASPSSPIPCKVNVAIATVQSDTAIKGKQLLTRQLPPEVLELALSFIPETASLVCVARVSRLYYMTVCNILMHRLKVKIEHLREALPKDENGQTLADETGVYSKLVNRWNENNQAIGYRELEQRVSKLIELVNEIGVWTRCWSPRRKTLAERTVASSPVFT